MKSLTLLSIWAVPLLLLVWGNEPAPKNELLSPDACPPLACVDSVTVSMNYECIVNLTADMLLSDAYADCLDRLEVEVFDARTGSLGNVVSSAYVGQTLQYKIQNLDDPDDSCWGHVTFQDNTPPQLTCPDPTSYAVNVAFANQLEGELSPDDPAFQRQNFPCWLSNETQAVGNYYLDTLAFQVAADGIYTFVLLADFAEEARGAGAVFQGDFFAENPCQNIIGFTEGGSLVSEWQTIQDWWVATPGLGDLLADLNINQNRPLLRIDLELRKDEDYFLATTSLKPEDTGNYVWLVLRDQITEAPEDEILKDEEVIEIPWRTKLLCEDIEQITLSGENCYTTDAEGNVTFISESLRAKLQLTGYPHLGDPWFTGNGVVTDNCDDVEVCVADQLATSQGECDAHVLERTFTATDGKGHQTSCVQQITVEKPKLTDVVLPNFTAYIECDEDFPLDSLGNPSPSITGYPLVKTAFGIHDLTKPFCNIAATYTDKQRAQICEQAHKFIRVWTLFDWCKPGSTFIYHQLIKVGDFTPPELLGPVGSDCVPTYSTGPFSCFASVKIPEPDSVWDNCSGWKVFVDVLAENGDLLARGLKPGDVAGRIPVGLNTFRYRAEDDCKNVGVYDCHFEVLDLNEPVAQCVDFLNVSLGGRSTYGSTRVAAKDIDEGSYDDCGEVELATRRSFADETCATAYADALFRMDLDDLVLLTVAEQEAAGVHIYEFNRYYHEPVDAYFTEDPRPNINENFANAELVLTRENGILYSILQPHVDFLCCDLRDTVRVELWAWDDANGNGIFGDTLQNQGFCKRTIADNHGVCWAEVLVEDKSAPACKAPNNLTVNCLDEGIRYTSDFTCADSAFLDEQFGAFTAIDNCGATVVCDTVIDNRDNCGIGTITRVYYAVDDSGNRSAPCEQVITVEPGHDYLIGFPADVGGECSAVIDTVIELREMGCDLLTLNVTDERFSVGVDGCFKIRRRFRVLNWCEFDGVSEPITIGRDEDCDGEAGDEPVFVIRRPDEAGELPAFIDRNDNEADNNPRAGEIGPGCPENPEGYWRKSHSTGYWQYTQIIDVFDTEPPAAFPSPTGVFCTMGTACTANIGVPILVSEACTPDQIEFAVRIDLFNDSTDILTFEGEKIAGVYPKFRYEDNLPIGEHTVEVQIFDGCGNVSSVRLPIEVADCSPPSLTCINGLATVLMPVIPAADVNSDGNPDDAFAEIWAEDLVKDFSDNCSEGTVRFSINRLGDTADINQDRLIFTCEDAGSTVPVEVYAWDSADNPDIVKPDGSIGGPNSSFCVTYVLVQENSPSGCGNDNNQGIVAGHILNPNGMPLAGATVRLPNASNSHVITDASGRYIASVPTNAGEMLIEPYHNEAIMRGISTYDLVLISRHILGAERFHSPYQFIAADVDNSQSVSILDLIQLRRLILLADNTFPKNTSWRFVAEQYEFPVPDNPWHQRFPELLRLRDFSERVTDANFTAVKIGDIDFSALGNARNTGFGADFELKIQDQELIPGQEIEVPVLANLQNILGYQFALQFDPQALTLSDVTHGVTQAAHFGWRYLDEGTILTSWNDQVERTDEQRLFTLKFTSQQGGKLSDFLKISPRYLTPEAYAPNGQWLRPKLQFAQAKSAMALYQNTPNPFAEVTTIRFFLPSATDAQLTIFTGEGKPLYTINRQFDSGNQEVTIDKNALPGGGVYFYVLEADGFRFVKRMILL